MCCVCVCVCVVWRARAQRVFSERSAHNRCVKTLMAVAVLVVAGLQLGLPALELDRAALTALITSTKTHTTRKNGRDHNTFFVCEPTLSLGICRNEDGRLPPNKQNTNKNKCAEIYMSPHTNKMNAKPVVDSDRCRWVLFGHLRTVQTSTNNNLSRRRVRTCTSRVHVGGCCPSSRAFVRDQSKWIWILQ